MDFSVVLLIYNSNKDDLKISLDSVLAQKDVSFEIILADDASKNNALDVAEKYLTDKGHSNYKLCKHVENVGTVKNIYDAVQIASGKYIKLIGAGDALFNDSVLKDIYKFMDLNSHSLCFGKLKGYKRNGDYLDFFNIELPFDIRSYERNDMNRIKKNILVNHGWIVGASMFFSNKDLLPLLEELIDNVKYCEDLSQSLVLLHDYSVGFYNDGVVYYEVGDGISTSADSSSRRRVLQDAVSFKEYLINNYAENPFIKQGDKMFKWQHIENEFERKIKIFFGNPDYLFMLIKTRLQKRSYVIREKGLLEKEV